MRGPSLVGPTRDDNSATLAAVTAAVPGLWTCRPILGICLIIIPLHLVITLEPPQDVDQDTSCGSGRDHRGRARSGSGIGSLGSLLFWEI